MREFLTVLKVLIYLIFHEMNWFLALPCLYAVAVDESQPIPVQGGGNSPNILPCYLDGLLRTHFVRAELLPKVFQAVERTAQRAAAISIASQIVRQEGWATWSEVFATPEAMIHGENNNNEVVVLGFIF